MEGAPGVEHHPETIDETWGAQVHFDKYEDRSFSVDGDVQIETSGKGSSGEWISKAKRRSSVSGTVGLKHFGERWEIEM